MRTLNHPEREEIRLDAVLSALSDPMRRTIACKLSSCEETWSCGNFGLPISKSTATYHFRILRESGIIRQQYEGTSIMNSLRGDDLDALFPGLLQAVFDAQHVENLAHAVAKPYQVPKSA